LSDRTLAVECIGGHDRAFQRQHLQQLRQAGISFDLASVAICASTKRCSQPQALTMCIANLCQAPK
jgi:hypothetical protein